MRTSLPKSVLSWRKTSKEKYDWRTQIAHRLRAGNRAGSVSWLAFSWCHVALALFQQLGRNIPGSHRSLQPRPATVGQPSPIHVVRLGYTLRPTLSALWAQQLKPEVPGCQIGRHIAHGASFWRRWLPKLGSGDYRGAFWATSLMNTFIRQKIAATF